MAVDSALHEAASVTRTAPLVDHLRELRRRVLICTVAVVVGAAAAFSVSDQLIELLRGPLGSTKLRLCVYPRRPWTPLSCRQGRPNLPTLARSISLRRLKPNYFF